MLRLCNWLTREMDCSSLMKTKSQKRIDILQFNCRSFLANINEIKSQLAFQLPGLVLVQETSLNTDKNVKIDGFTVKSVDCATPRRAGALIRRGGLLRLINQSNSNLLYEILPLIHTPPDKTIETQQLHLYIGNELNMIHLDVISTSLPFILIITWETNESNTSRQWAPSL